MKKDKTNRIKEQPYLNKVLITGAVIVLILGIFLFVLLVGFFKEDKDTCSAGIYIRDDYATVAWVESMLEIYTGNMATETEINKITESIERLDRSFFNNMTDDDLRDLYCYINRMIKQNVGDLPMETVSELSNYITEGLIERYKVNLSEDDLRALKSSISDLQFELSLLDETGMDIGDTLSEEDVEYLIISSGLSKEVIEGWIKSAGIDLTNGYEEADEELLIKVGQSDEDLMYEIDEANEKIDSLYRDIVSLHEGKYDTENADERLNSIRLEITELERTISGLDTSSAGNNEDLSNRLLLLKDELNKLKNEYESDLQSYKAEQSKKLRLTRNELEDEISGSKEEAKDNLSKVKDSMESNFNKTNNRVADLENKNLLEYQVDISDPDNPVLILTPVTLQIKQ